MRMHGHAAHDDMRYVPPELLAAWAERDPIELQERRVAAFGVDVEALRAEVDAEVERAAAEALAAPMPDPAGAAHGAFAVGEAQPLGDGCAPWSGFAEASA
jgi:TPP-dependent pyruvate/acetoin dehydrogenase alpha subunit